ncbi:hypothetical protein FHS61_002025 [Altererythrobacter atlanticus]|uniref:YhhN-like protein n=1 Tax=Croceibacterium atlanticum TaxID=1267766 RepID=A0A0F7KQT2_9SPHN|nr:lysoplasmalogenase family protein [Croceibacterium atlanticum]AKH41537.1 YhhN-like protein [Croceibacterium atlanticum]MBB5732999.1 hypothetical protein [Croceibacterium atlanticum]
MPKRALAQKRPFLLASIAAALAFYYLRAGPYPDVILIPLKGSAVALLAIYAWLRHMSQDARLLAIMLVLAALGDMALEFYSGVAAVIFFGHHVVALMLYLRHRRERLAPSQKATVVALLLLTPAIAWLLPADPAGREQALIYGFSLGGMAASAWASSFPRYRVGAGAVLFLLAHMLLIAEFGPLEGNEIPRIFAWPVYYLGQLLIVTGIAQTLRKRDPELRLVK